jgi:transposase
VHPQWLIERTFAWLHAFKRLRIRSERRVDIHQGLLSLACSVICLRMLNNNSN